MSSQRMRAEMLVENMANAETTRTPEGGPYRRKDVVFKKFQHRRGFFLPVFGLLFLLASDFRLPIGFLALALYFVSSLKRELLGSSPPPRFPGADGHAL